MHDSPKEFKRPPKKHAPKGCAILYEDRDIIVVNKVSGLLTMGNDKIRHNTAYYHVTNYVRKGNHKSRSRVFIVHRLDRETSGVLVLAKNHAAKTFLQDQWQEVKKKYYAIAVGRMPAQEGTITSYLAENQAKKMYSTSDTRQGKLSKTAYKVIRESGKYSLLEIDILTGRKNQIRVHLADEGCPVSGDRKYGEREKGSKRLALHAASITIRHPYSKEEMTFSTTIPAYFDILMKGHRKRK